MTTPAPDPVAVVSAWLQPRSRWLVWPVIILAIAAAFGLGTLAGPERVDERWSVITTVRKVEVKAKQRQRNTYTKVVILPDGTKTTERSTAEALRVDSTTRIDSHIADVREKTTAARPDWRVGVLLGGAFNPSPLQLQPAVGAYGERRILGPFSLGAWGIVEIPAAGALPRGLAGLSVSGEF